MSIIGPTLQLVRYSGSQLGLGAVRTAWSLPIVRQNVRRDNRIELETSIDSSGGLVLQYLAVVCLITGLSDLGAP